MSMENVTILLGEMREGNSQARSDLFNQVYAELMRLAMGRLAGGQTTHLDAPSLVHEAYLRLTDEHLVSLRDRREFFAYSSTIMHNVIIDYVRRQKSQKRGSDATHLTLSGADLKLSADDPNVEALHSALEHLAQIDERGHRVVEMRYFAGMSIDEIADVLDISGQTVKRSWQTARAFLFKALQE